VVINYRSNDATAKEVMDEIRMLGRKAVALKADVGSYQDARSMVDQAVQGVGVDIWLTMLDCIQARFAFEDG